MNNRQYQNRKAHKTNALIFMSSAKQMHLTESSLGRIKLHVLALIKDHHFKFHMAGIIREITHRRIYHERHA